MGDEDFVDKKKAHRKKHAGVSADKKKSKNQQPAENLTARQRNPKAFSIQSAVRAENRFRRKEDLTAKRQHIPLVDKTPDEPPPILIGVVGPPKVGKTTLINNLIRNFTKTNVTDINGPITIVTSKKRRITLIECNNDINSMIDIAKCVDLVLLLCDASFGFEMEIFEFLNICQVHGMPKIMGVLTHLDAIKNAKTLKRRKKELKHRFWTEVYNGAKLFYLSGIIHGEYLRNEITNLGRFISIMKFRPLTWRGAHSYIIADRMEDVTNTEEIRLNSKCDRNIILYGYVRGVPLNRETAVHIAGLGDLKINELTVLSDPCPLPNREKKRSLLEKERLLYAPMSGVGGIVYDKDAVYIELQGSHSHRKGGDGGNDDADGDGDEKTDIVNDLIRKRETFDEQIHNQEFKLFSDGDIIKSGDFVEEQQVDEDEADDDDDDDLENESDSGMEDDDKEQSQNWMGEDDNDDNENDSDETSDEEYQDEIQKRNKNNNLQSDDEDEEEDDDDDEEDTDSENNIIKNNMSWKEGLTQKARTAYLERQANSQNLMKIVYGVFNKFSKKNLNSDDENDDGENDDEDENTVNNNSNNKIGGLFKVMAHEQEKKHKEKGNQNIDESCFFESYGDETRNWLDDLNTKLIKNCFVTGKWRKNEDAEELLRLDDLSDAGEDDDDEVFGDFEDLETGKKVNSNSLANNKDPTTENVDDKGSNKLKRSMSRVEESNLSKTELLAKKLKLKAQFDTEYDKVDGDGRITGDHQYYEELKAEATKQSELNRTEFNKLDENLRIQIEGYRAGLYVRIGFNGISSEFVEHFNPQYPILIGGLNMAEENIGYVNCKVKKHRWYKRILKTADPLIISMGWRRFQTIPIFAKIEDDMKHRYLKYTPNHITCSMTFWGPITPQNTGFLAVQSVEQNQEQIKRIGFRIAATGCVTEIDKSTRIMKKLKLIGQPFKIYKKSAFVKGMFTSQLEVAKFEGAKIKTVSGIRGQIKKAHSKPEGSFRATFEDRILLSDIVFCRTWFRVDIPQFYAPITTLLLPPAEKSQWQGMKTVAQLKRERNIRNDAKYDSMYREIVRQPKEFKPLQIPKALQNALPYKDKPKQGPKNPRMPFDSNRIAVIHSPHEQKIANMMKMLKTNYQAKKDKEQQDKELRIGKFKAQKHAEEVRRLRRQKELRKKICRTISKMDKSKSTTAAGGSGGGGGARRGGGGFKKKR